MSFTEHEMHGLIAGKCVAGDMKVNEELPAYLVRKMLELESERDMYRNAEMSWEKAMMSAIGEDGTGSVTKAISDIKAERDALASENVAMKEFGDTLNDMHNNLNGEGTGIQGRAEVACQQVALEAALEEFDAIQTPATDAYANQLRAEGIDAWIESRNGAWNGTTEQAKQFAANLRKENGNG